MELQLGSFIAGHKITKCLYNRNTKGAVYSAYENQLAEEKDNLAVCRILADKLGTCVLLPPVPNKKTADMMRADDLSLWEIKTNHSGNAKTISRALQDAKTQSCNAIVHVVAGVCDMKAIERAAALRKHFSALENIILIRANQLVFV